MSDWRGLSKAFEKRFTVEMEISNMLFCLVERYLDHCFGNSIVRIGLQ